MNRRDSSATLQHWSWCISTKHEGATRAHPDNWKMKAKKFAAPPAFNICRLWMDQNKTDCPEHKVETKSLAGSDTSHWGSCMRGSSKREVSIWVLWSPAMAPWLQLDNIHSVEHHTTATQENSPSNLLQLDNCFRENKNKYVPFWWNCRSVCRIIALDWDANFLNDTKFQPEYCTWYHPALLIGTSRGLAAYIIQAAFKPGFSRN